MASRAISWMVVFWGLVLTVISCVNASAGCVDEKVDDGGGLGGPGSGIDVGFAKERVDGLEKNATFVDAASRNNGGDIGEMLEGISGLQSPKAENSTTPLYEIRPTKTKGLGIFALRPIPSGVLILIEAPLMTVPLPSLLPGAGFHLASMIPSLEASFLLLTSAEQATVLSLHDHRFPSEDEDGTSHLLTIFRSNAYNTGEGEIGLFPKTARINHSCRPNAGNWWSEGLRRRVIYAARDVSVGEEVTVSYIPLLKGTEERRGRLKQYGFLCGCEACMEGGEGKGGRGDRRRIRIAEVLDELEGVEGSGGGLDETATQRDAKMEKLIKRAVKLVEWVEGEDGLGDYKARVYRLAAVFNMRRGWLGTAEGWARKELQLWDWAERGSQEVLGVKEFMKNLREVSWR